MHSGGRTLTYLPCSLVRRTGDATRDASSFDLARVFGGPTCVIFPAANPGGLAGGAERANVAGIGAELAGGGVVDRAGLGVEPEGVVRILRHAGILPRWCSSMSEQAAPRLMNVPDASFYVYASENGIFEPFVDLGDKVEAGRPVGAIHFVMTPTRPAVAVEAQRAGVVVAKRAMALYQAVGDCLLHLGDEVPWP